MWGADAKADNKEEPGTSFGAEDASTTGTETSGATAVVKFGRPGHAERGGPTVGPAVGTDAGRETRFVADGRLGRFTVGASTTLGLSRRRFRDGLEDTFAEAGVIGMGNDLWRQCAPSPTALG